MNIRTFPARFAAFATLFALALPAQAQTLTRPAYLEVVPLTIKWTRTTSAITRSRTSEGNGADPVAPITTDTIRTIADIAPTGSYADFVAQIAQGVGRPTGAPDWNFEGNRSVILDLVAVRLPARSVEEFATNPYHIYLTATDRRTRTNPFTPRLVDDVFDPVSTPVDTGLTLTFGEYISRTTETFDNQGRLYDARGSISTSFKVEYSTTWYPTPSDLPRHMFLMTARGTAAYTLRTVKLNGDVGTPAFLAPAATTLRGIGYHAHDYIESDPTKNYTHLGLAPVSIVLGSAKYIAQERFPDFVLPNVPTNADANADSATQISLGWTDASDNESVFQVERRAGGSGPWEAIATLSEDSDDFVDDTVAAGTTYFYRVRAGNRFGFSAYSAETSATTPAVP